MDQNCDLHSYKHVILDFDGVLSETNTIRFEGFRLLFSDYPDDHVAELIEYARSNGGLSRYDKIRQFFEKIRNEAITTEEVDVLAKKYSDLVKQKVIDSVLVRGSVEFLNSYYQYCNLAIVSGSDQDELRGVCRVRGIDKFFVKILGSPESKEKNLYKLLSEMKWKNKECLFIGDSLNDLSAAAANGIAFLGRNSGLVDWSSMSNIVYIDDFSQLNLSLLSLDKNPIKIPQRRTV